MKRDRYKNYTVEDLVRYDFIHPAVAKDNPMPPNCLICPYDYYGSLGLLNAYDGDFVGQIEDHEDVFVNKRGKEAMSAIMKAGGGRIAPSTIREYLEDKGLWEETELF